VLFQALALGLLAQTATQRIAAQRGESSSQTGLDLLHDAGKSRLVVHSDIGQHFAVDLDGSLLQTIGELAVFTPCSSLN
jgi:hypothetical protein